MLFVYSAQVAPLRGRSEWLRAEEPKEYAVSFIPNPPFFMLRNVNCCENGFRLPCRFRELLVSCLILYQCSEPVARPYRIAFCLLQCIFVETSMLLFAGLRQVQRVGETKRLEAESVKINVALAKALERIDGLWARILGVFPASVREGRS